MATHVSFDAVSLTYEGPNANRTKVFTDLSFEIARGEFVAIIGPSGCGKTSVQKMICGLLPPSSGRIAIDGMDPADARKKRLFSYVFQNPVLFRWRTVRENILLPAEIVNSGSYEGRAEELIHTVGLTGFADAYPDMLSGGMQSRAQIARALLLEPEGLALDECFGHLDEITRFRMNLELLRIWGISRPTIVFVTHSVEEAAFLSDRVLVFGQRPVGIVSSLAVEIPRPRDLDAMNTLEFRNIVSRIRDTLASTHIDPPEMKTSASDVSAEG